MANVFFKPVQSLISTKKETQTLRDLNSSGLTYTLCDRTDLSSKGANYFVSFNLPFESDALLSGSSLSLSNPELQQLNVDKIVFSPIPKELYGELIDGRSITFMVPQVSGSTTASTMSAKTVVSSTYSTLQKVASNALLGKNIAFLFSDDINKPYTGTTGSNSINHANTSTWTASTFVNRPAAVAYSNLNSSDINTDQRSFSSVDLAVAISENYPTNTNIGYNYDIPVGFICLDKGFVVLTHPTIVDNIPFNQGQQLHTNTVNTGSTSATTDIYFSDTNKSDLVFTDTNISFVTSVVCLALPGEFYFTNNPTWNVAKNLIEEQNSTNGFDSTQVTEVGLYNIIGELLAIAKLDRPVEKNIINLMTFNLDIDV